MSARDTDAWLSTADVAMRLGVKKETVYAYVSKGLLPAEKVGRESRFRLKDVQNLITRTRVPSVDGHRSTIFSREAGSLTYRGESVHELADSTSFETVCDLLWGASEDIGGWPGVNAETIDTVTRCLHEVGARNLVSDDLRIAVTVLGALDGPGSSYHVPEVISTGRRLLKSMIASLRPVGPRQASGDADASIAALLWPRLSLVDVRDEHLRLVNAALILSADHGLAPSTRVARTAASLGATSYGVVSAGMGAGTNDIAGSSALRVEDLIRRLADPHAIRALVDEARVQGNLAGFGHPLYPDGDPRAGHLFRLMDEIVGDDPRYQSVKAFCRVMLERGLDPPGYYLALAAMSFTFNMARGSTEAVFHVGRSAGWIAHAIEEYWERPEQREP